MHRPVLLNEVIKYLDPKHGRDYIDCTIGLGGHSIEILKHNGPDGKVLGIDQDKEAMKIAREGLREFRDRLILVNGHFGDLGEIAEMNGFTKVAGILFDLGISSLQLESDRGFSFQKESRLDMRMDEDIEISAYDVINTFSESKLYEIFHDLGEERYSRKIVKEILRRREKQEIDTTIELAEIASRSISRKRKLKIHPATKIFQALRIYVNDELNQLQKALPEAVKILGNGGKIAVIAFHSLEDRIVKNFFKRESRDCICPSDIPQCVCDHRKTLKILTKKPIQPSKIETKSNPRSRSAKLRVAEKREVG